MAVDIVMPNLGFDTQSGHLIEWLKQPGDTVAKGEILAVVESDKANVELESVTAGVLLELLVPADTDVAVGAVIARVGTSDEVRSVASQSKPTTAVTTSITAAFPPVGQELRQDNPLDLRSVSGSETGAKVIRSDINSSKTASLNSAFLALPKVRKAARQAEIDLSIIPPTGQKGQITLADLQRYIGDLSASTPTTFTAGANLAATREDAQEIPLSRARMVIGERLSKSKQDAPHFYVSGEFDVEVAIQHLPAQTRVNDLIQYLSVQALLRVPELNATFEHDRLYRYDHINLGIAVALGDGLITPVLHNAEQYSLQGIAAEGRDLIQRTRENHLRTDDLQGGTFTISNLGVIKQVERFTAIINPPQVAILAVGTVKQRPVVINGGVHIRHTVHLTLSGDHRVVDGMHLASYMAAFQEELDKFTK